MVFEGNSLVPLDSEDPRQFREELTASACPRFGFVLARR